MGSKKDKVKTVKDKRGKDELRAALARAEGLLDALADEVDPRLDAMADVADELTDQLLPFRAVADKLATACPPGVKCNQMVHVIAYPCGKPSVVVETDLSAWRAVQTPK